MKREAYSGEKPLSGFVNKLHGPGAFDKLNSLGSNKQTTVIKVLRGKAKTTYAMRQEIQEYQESISTLD